MSRIIKAKTFVLHKKCTQIKLFLPSAYPYWLLGLMSTKILAAGKISTPNKNTQSNNFYRKIIRLLSVGAFKFVFNS